MKRTDCVQVAWQYAIQPKNMVVLASLTIGSKGSAGVSGPGRGTCSTVCFAVRVLGIRILNVVINMLYCCQTYKAVAILGQCFTNYSTVCDIEAISSYSFKSMSRTYSNSAE